MPAAGTNADVVRVMLESVGVGKLDRALAVLDPEIEWHSTAGFLEQSVYRGKEELLGFYEALSASFPDFRTEVDRYVELEGGLVVAQGRMAGRGQGSGIEVDVPRVWACEVRDGLVVRVRVFESLDEAGRALDLDLAD